MALIGVTEMRPRELHGFSSCVGPMLTPPSYTLRGNTHVDGSERIILPFNVVKALRACTTCPYANTRKCFIGSKLAMLEQPFHRTSHRFREHHTAKHSLGTSHSMVMHPPLRYSSYILSVNNCAGNLGRDESVPYPPRERAQGAPQQRSGKRSKVCFVPYGPRMPHGTARDSLSLQYMRPCPNVPPSMPHTRNDGEDQRAAHDATVDAVEASGPEQADNVPPSVLAPSSLRLAGPSPGVLSSGCAIARLVG
ncbi:hypothetical protein F5148DRAFT_1279169 [Russula earlei]|uniref:Uncharacterized protein n=1 Tax=Russula earlei TaxID=71964 RepID=A0ACC0UPX9_9AGAM|nr:hypothetical protein F5148DRAFT_1279169 [Russula earlei]